MNGSIEPETLRQLAENKLHDETSNKQEAAKGALQILDAIAWKTEFDIKESVPDIARFTFLLLLTEGPFHLHQLLPIIQAHLCTHKRRSQLDVYHKGSHQGFRKRWR